jgi:hypothetical protein
MGFTVGDTGPPDLSQHQRTHLLGRYTDLNEFSWTLVTIKAHLAATAGDTPTVVESTHEDQSYTYFQLLPTLADKPGFLVHHPRRTSFLHGLALASCPWTPKFLPEQRVYTDRSDITSLPGLGAAVVHIPTCNTIYIYAAGT